MKRKTLVTMFTALGLLLSGASHALLIWMPNGIKTEAQIVGNKLMLQDPKGNLKPAGDGIYKTIDGKSLNVKGGVIVPGGGAPATGSIEPEVNKAKGGAAPMQQVPLVPAPKQQVPFGSAPVSPPGPVGVQPPVAGGFAVKAIRLEQITSKAQFKALADDTLLEIDGKQIRKADFVAEFNSRVADKSAGDAIRTDGLAAIQARLTSEEDAAIAASDAEVRRRMAEIKAQGSER